MKTFHCNFGNRVGVTVKASDSPPSRGANHVHSITWTRRPPPEVVPRYIEWMHEVNQTLANEWGANLMYVFCLYSNRAESWCYAPGQIPKMIEPAIPPLTPK